MKKIVFLCLAFSFYVFTAQAIELTLSQEMGSVGNQVTVKLTTKGFTNVIGTQFSINFDPAVLQYVSISTASPAALGYKIGTTNTALGQIGVLWINPALVGQSLTDDVELMQIRFQIIGGAGTNSRLTIGNTPTPYKAIDGGLAYTATTSVGGSVQVAAILPIDLQSFTAKLTNKTTAELNWQTTTEKNADYFSIEHGTHGKPFQNIGKILAFGNSTTPQYYSFLHSISSDAIHYYRLKIVDRDGQFNYSKTLSISRDTEGSILIQKRGKELIVNGLLSNTDVTVSLSDIMGRTVFSEKKHVNTEGSLFQYLPTLSSGLYIATIRSKQFMQSAKIFIEK